MSDKERKIVVGIEGSGGAKAALKWAIQEAKFRRATIVVATAFSPSWVPVSPDFTYIPVDNFNVEDEVGRMQEQIAHEVLEELGAEKTDIEYVRKKGSPADTLISIAEAEDADMLVVGSRGRGGVRGLLLGSVSHQIAHHGCCPVVIVRPDLDVKVEDVDGSARQDEEADGDTPPDDTPPDYEPIQQAGLPPS